MWFERLWVKNLFFPTTKPTKILPPRNYLLYGINHQTDCYWNLHFTHPTVSTECSTYHPTHCPFHILNLLTEGIGVPTQTLWECDYLYLNSTRIREWCEYIVTSASVVVEHNGCLKAHSHYACFGCTSDSHPVDAHRRAFTLAVQQVNWADK